MLNPCNRPAWTKFETIAHTIEAIKKINEEKAAISATSILYQINDNQPTHGPMKVSLHRCWFRFVQKDRILSPIVVNVINI